MFDINRTIIKDSSRALTYLRGLRYYLHGNVTKIDLEVDTFGKLKEFHINSTVKSSSNLDKKYHVDATFRSDFDGIHYNCDCPSYHSFHNEGLLCKHAVASLLKYVSEKDTLIKYINVKSHKNLINEIKNNFSNYISDIKKIYLNLEFKLVVENSHYNFISLQLKIGEKKLYVVKNMREFLNAVLNKDSLIFGKNFTLDFNIYEFKEEDKKILELLIELFEIDYTSKIINKGWDTDVKFLSGKNAHLTESTTIKIFKALNNRTIELDLNNHIFKNVSIIEGDIPIKFKLKDETDTILMEQCSDIPIPFKSSGKYFFYNNSIYLPSDEQIKMYKPFFNTFIRNKTNSITFNKEENMAIASYILPALKKITSNVSIDEKITDKFHNDPLISSLYLDKIDKNSISASIIFEYGELKIEALKGIDKLDTLNPLVRDIEKENLVVNTLKSFGFKEKNSNFILDDNEKVLYFIINGGDKLGKLCNIYYSNSFKEIKVYNSSSYKSSVKLTDENLLDFSFKIDGVDNKELKNIFKALKEKKKYYKLKSGSFVSLQSDNLAAVSNMIDYLNIKDTDVESGHMLLSKYNAAYIDSRINDNTLNFIQTDEKFNSLIDEIKSIKEVNYTIPENLENIMRDYQKFGFKWFKTLSKLGFGGILADEMGLGKTLQTIAFIKSGTDFSKNKMPSLVVCPSSILYNWEDEIKKFEPKLTPLVICGSKAERELEFKNIVNSDIVITSYPLIRRDLDKYKNIKFRYCFLDEAQNIKNPNSLNSKSVKEIQANNYFALTGTPIENSLTELWSIFDFIMPGYLLSHTKFLQKYEVPIIKDNDKNSLKDLNAHIRPFILRRLKKDVIKELPDKIEHNLLIDMTKEQKKIYAAFLKQSKDEMEEEINKNGFKKSKFKILTLLTRLRQICCDPSIFIENYTGKSCKMIALIDIIENNISSGHKMLLFSQFTSVLKNIKEELKNRKIDYLYLDGNTENSKRLSIVNEFNESSIPIFLISLKAGGTGLNLTSADTVIHFDPWWNPAVEDQASDRAHRIGQKKTVEVIKLLTKGTIEEKINKIQNKKKKIIENVLDKNSNTNNLISQMDENEVKNLFI